MTDNNPSIISHVSLGSNRFQQAATFYDRVLGVLGCMRILEESDMIAYGRQFPEFWLHKPIDGKPATVGNGTHIGFAVASQAQVHAFYDEALAAGATGDGAPGPRPHYGEPYYGCYVRDLDGHKIEATFWDMALARRLGMMP